MSYEFQFRTPRHEINLGKKNKKKNLTELSKPSAPNQNDEIEKRLKRIEAKLDLIIDHFGL